MDVSFLLQPQFDLWEAVCNLIDLWEASFEHPYATRTKFTKNQILKRTGKRVKKNWKSKKRKKQEKRPRKRGTRGRELEHTDSLEPPPPIVEASLCLRSSLTLFQLFVQGRQLVLHLPDFVLREGLLPTNIYEYLVTSFECQFSKWSTFFCCINGDNRSRDKTRVYRNEIWPSSIWWMHETFGAEVVPPLPPEGEGRGASGGIFCKQIDLWF